MISEDVFQRLAARCSVAEMCVSDARKKLDASDLAEQEKEDILHRLITERFIDENRYARAFVRDKFRFSGWGRQKINQALRLKGVGRTDITAAMEEIDEEEYRQALHRLLQSKRRSVKGRSDYEINGKLIRFALGRGYEMPLILKELDANEWDFD